jgi:hypothetical protein
MIIGGIAVIARGVRRLTTDVDVAVRGDAVDVAVLLRALARRGIVPRIARADAFARVHLVLLLRHRPTGVDLDVSLAWSAFEHEALARCTDARFGTVQAPMARPEDLVIYKAVAGRPRDLDDVEALLLLHRNIDLARVRRRVTELAALAEAPGLALGLEGVIARVRRAQRRG